MEGRKQFTFYRSYYNGILKLPVEKRLAVYEAVVRYALDRIQPEGLDDMQDMAMVLITPTLDSGWEKAMAGRKGGKKTKDEFKQLSKGEKEEDIEKEVEKENKIEIENEIEDECPMARFEAFWDLYPVKLGKDKAREVWERLNPDSQAVCDGVRQWLQTEQWKEKDGRFIPRAAKFLEEEHYKQLPAGHIPPGASGVLGKAELEAIERLMRE